MVHENSNISAKNRLPLSAVFINIYLFVMFTVFPLYVAMYFDGKLPFLHMDNGFVGIRHQKYYFFLVMTAIAAIAEVLLLLTQANSVFYAARCQRFCRRTESLRFSEKPPSAATLRGETTA